MVHWNLVPRRRTASHPVERVDPFGGVQDSFRDLFDGFFGRGSVLPSVFRTDEGVRTLPRLDVHETEEEVLVEAELPGVAEGDVEVTLDDSTLTIRGEKRTEEERQDKGTLYSERTFGSFERRVPLHVEVDAEAVAASMDNGVLTVRLPKSKAAKQSVHQIQVTRNG